jgi:aquaporin TIP
MSIQMGFQPEDFDLQTFRAVVAEFLATGMFVTLGVGSVIAANAAAAEQFVLAERPIPEAVPPPWVLTAIAIAHGLGFLLAVAATMRISGGHINPAVTFAMVMTGNMSVAKGILYWAAQLAGATLAVLFLKAVILAPYESGLGVHGLGPMLEENVGDGAGAGLLIEIVLTAFLVYVVFATAVDPKGPAHLAPAAIGLTVMAIYFVAIPLTGGSVNPARSFGPALVAMEWTDHWIYWLGPLIGAGVAGLVYQFVYLLGDGEERAGEPPPAPPEA